MSAAAKFRYGRISGDMASSWCATLLAEKRAEGAKRAAKLEESREAYRQRQSEHREDLENNPFDPRTEVSADAKHIASRIVTHLWILFVLLPVIIGVLLEVLGVIK